MARISDNRVAGLLVAGIVGALIAGGLALAIVTGGDSARDDAATAHAADMAVASQDLAMSAIGQAILLAEGAESGAVVPAAVTAATSEADAAIARVGSFFNALPDSVQTSLSSKYSNWVTSAAAVVDAVDGGEAARASATLADSVAPAADDLAAGLLAERDARSSAVADADGGLGVGARLAGFLLVFLLPAIAILIYRESARRQLQAAAAHLDARIEAGEAAGKDKDQLVAEFASKMQVPLASIHEFSAMLIDGDSSPDRTSDLIGMINSHSEELSNRVEDALAASNSLPAVTTETLEMADEIDNAISAVVSNGQSVGGAYGAGTVVADPVRVQQILRNLLVNAATHGGPKVSVFGDVAGSKYVVAVEDNGQGLPDHVVNEFEAETAPLESEAGMGLAVCRQLAAAMAGSLEYDRVAGRTAFILSLPLVEEPVEVPASDDVLIAMEQ